MTAYFLTLQRPSLDRTLDTLAEAIVPGPDVNASANELLRSLNFSVNHPDTLFLYREPGARMQVGDCLYDGRRTWLITHAPTGTGQLVVLE